MRRSRTGARPSAPRVVDDWSTMTTRATVHTGRPGVDAPLTLELQVTTDAPDQVCLRFGRDDGRGDASAGALTIAAREVDGLAALLAHVVAQARRDGVLPRGVTS